MFECFFRAFDNRFIDHLAVDAEGTLFDSSVLVEDFSGELDLDLRRSIHAVDDVNLIGMDRRLGVHAERLPLCP